VTEATAVKARILWLDADYSSVEKYLIGAIRNRGGHDVRAYSSLDKIPVAIREQIEEFDLVIVEPLNTMVTKESVAFYEALRDRFVKLPPLPRSFLLEGLGTIYALKCLAPSVPLMIYTNITENTKVGRQALEELKNTENVTRIIKQPLLYKELLTEIEKAIGGKTQEK